MGDVQPNIQLCAKSTVPDTKQPNNSNANQYRLFDDMLPMLSGVLLFIDKKIGLLVSFHRNEKVAFLSSEFAE